MGAIFGIFTASVDPMYTINPNKIPTLKEIALEFKTRALSTGKNFALLGVIFSAFECNIESYRGKTDLYNGFTAGFLTGGVLGIYSLRLNLFHYEILEKCFCLRSQSWC